MTKKWDRWKPGSAQNVEASATAAAAEGRKDNNPQGDWSTLPRKENKGLPMRYYICFYLAIHIIFNCLSILCCMLLVHYG